MTKYKIKWHEIVLTRMYDFLKNWIYPGYYLKNLLFYRYDCIKLNGYSRYKYFDKDQIMFDVNMQLITNFIDKENPEKHIFWYKDENGNEVGHKYGEKNIYDKTLILYPEYKDKFIMDIIKEIYHWYKIDYIELQKDKDYLSLFWCDNIIGELTGLDDDTELDENSLTTMEFDNSNCPKTLDELLKKQNINWNILDKYIQDRNKIFEDDYVRNIIIELEAEIFSQKQKYLHLCIEVRPYLWT